MATTPTRWTTHIATMFAWDDALEDLYDSWQRRVAAAERGHRLMADRYRRRHITLGIAVALLGMSIATGALLSLREAEETISTGGFAPDTVLLLVGSIGVLVALLALTQTFLRSSAAAEGHRIAALRFEALELEMAATLATPREVRDKPDLMLTTTRLRMDRYSRESPPIRGRLRTKLQAEFGLSQPAPPSPPPAVVIPEAPAG